jgi:tetraacyldisaccharide 4'-kinase
VSPSPHRPTLAERLQREWLSGGALSTLLLPLSALYGLLAGLHRRLSRAETLPVPVVVVGNWIVGGAGKTPTTLALLDHLRARGLKAGVISRGYGRAGDEVRLLHRDSAASEVGDEPLLIHLRARVPVAVGRDRVAAARALLAAHPELQLLVSDDGLQHWRLPRQLSVLVFDERGLGNGRLLPAGPLRQRPKLAPDARELVLYTAGRPNTPRAGFVGRRSLRGAVRLQDWWQGKPATTAGLEELRDAGPPWVAAAGLAQPERFFDQLRGLGLRVEPLPLPDHHDFATLPWPADCAGVLLTEKDAVKLRPERLGSTPAWVLPLDFEPEPGFFAALDAALKRLLPHHPWTTA